MVERFTAWLRQVFALPAEAALRPVGKHPHQLTHLWLAPESRHEEETR